MRIIWWCIAISLIMLQMKALANTRSSAPQGPPEITQTDLSQIEIEGLQLGMNKQQAKKLIAELFSTQTSAKPSTSAAHKCRQQQCQAQRFSPEINQGLMVYFNQQDQLYWIKLTTQAHLGASAEECLRVATEQLAALRQEYGPEDQRHFFSANTVTLRLNKHGHPDPIDNSFYGYRVQIKCDPFAKGLAQTEIELRDNGL